jgi:signal transduction histidine kinase
MATSRGLARRLGRELLLQALYISAAVLVGVFIAANLIPDFMIRKSLEQEADYYWNRVQADPGHPLPDTLNLTAYLDSVEVPAELAALAPGYHRQAGDRETLTFVSERGGQRLYLVFEEEQVNRLLILFGLIPLSLALIVIYLSLYSGYRVSHRAVSPVVALAERVRQLDPAAPEPRLLEADDGEVVDEEILILGEALEGLVRRVGEFAERERNFTRDTSHELRTPLTVIKMAVDRLLRDAVLDEDSVRTLVRIRQSAEDMEHLTSAFLLLARESGEGLPGDWVSLNDVVAAELERARIVNPDSPIHVEFAHDKVLASVVGNLLRNALSYTDAGTVRVHIGGDSVTIEDTGPGMEPGQIEKAFKPYYRGGRQRGGFGVGLTIVKRLTERFDWPLDLSSKTNQGTRVSVRFPRSRIEEASRPRHGP